MMRTVVGVVCAVLLIAGITAVCSVGNATESQGAEQTMSHEQKMVSRVIEIVSSAKDKIDEVSANLDVYLRTFIEKYDSVRPEISNMRVRVVEKIERIRAELGKTEGSGESAQ